MGEYTPPPTGAVESPAMGNRDSDDTTRRKVKRILASPCDRPPASPTGVVFTATAVEARTHLRFRGKIKWDDVVTDTSGLPINTIDRWGIQWRATNSGGTPVESEDAKTVHRMTRGDPVSQIGITEAINVGSANEVQSVSLTGFSGTDSFHLTFGGNESGLITRGTNYRASRIKERIEAITGFTGTVEIDQVTDSGFTVTFGGTYAAQNVGSLSVTNPTGCTGNVTTTTQGDPGTGTFRFTTKGPHGFIVGQNIRVAGCKPTAFNGNYAIATKGADWFTVAGTTGVGELEVRGKVYDEDDSLHIHIPDLPRPKTWYWQARVRARSGEGCWSKWSDWTTPMLPWTGADPKPPEVTFGVNPIAFDNKGKGKHSKIRLKFTFNEVVDFDYPGSPADDEDDVDRYVIQIDRSDDGVTWDGPPYRTKTRQAKDADADTTVTMVFQTGIRRRFWYRCRVRCIDRFNRRGDWSIGSGDANGWTDAALPFDDDRPPQPLLVRIFESATDRVVLDWEDPVVYIPTRGTVSGTSGTATLTGTSTQFEKEVERGSTIRVDGNNYLVKSVASATSLTLATNLSTSPAGSSLRLVEDDPDVAFYQVQIAKSADVSGTPNHDWSAVYAKDRRNGTRRAFKIHNNDKGLTFFGRVRAVDAAWNKSKWVYARLTANSDETLSGEGVTVGNAGGSVVATFTKVGTLSVKHYSNRRWTNTTGQRLYFRKARATVGDKEAATGAPTGAAVKIQLKRWLYSGSPAEENTPESVFQTGGGGDDDDRLIIAAGKYKDTNGPETFDIEYLEPDEALSVRVAQVGSTLPGTDLTVQVFMEP